MTRSSAELEMLVPIKKERLNSNELHMPGLSTMTREMKMSRSAAVEITLRTWSTMATWFSMQVVLTIPMWLSTTVLKVTRPTITTLLTVRLMLRTNRSHHRSKTSDLHTNRQE
jgi:hypothetical protein